MDEKRTTREFFMFQTSDEDNRAISELARLLRMNRSAAVRAAVRLVLAAMKEEKNVRADGK